MLFDSNYFIAVLRYSQFLIQIELKKTKYNMSDLVSECVCLCVF
jgi:hypothetical protein